GFCILALALILAIAPRKSAQECQEIAFQNSPLFGKVPRRYFEIVPLEMESGILGNLFHAYLVSVACQPVVLIRSSAIFCGLTKSEELSESASLEYTRLFKDCKTN